MSEADTLAKSHAELVAALERTTRFIDWIDNNFCASGKVGEPYHRVHRDIVRVIHETPRKLLPQANAALSNAVEAAV